MSPILALPIPNIKRILEHGTNHDEKAADANLASTGMVGGVVVMELPALLKRRDKFDDPETDTVDDPLIMFMCGISYAHTHKSSTNIWKFCFCFFVIIILKNIFD